MNTILTQTIARALFLPSLMVAAGVMVKGYVSTGDGFAAGVIAALAVLLQVIVFGIDEAERQFPLRIAPVIAFAGLGLGLVIAFIPVFLGKPIMTHFPGPGEAVIHLGTLELLTAVAFDVGVFLLVFGFSVSAITIIARLQVRSGP
jgi:multisubunit Na+/H+ antiporter MnhB subunit